MCNQLPLIHLSSRNDCEHMALRLSLYRMHPSNVLVPRPHVYTKLCCSNPHALPCRFGAAAYVPALALEKPLYIRERNDGLYRPITYLLAKLFDELFITLFSSVFFALVVWYLVQVRPAGY